MPIPTDEKWAVYAFHCGWLVDTCAGGTWSWKVAESVEFDSRDDAIRALVAAEIPVTGVVLLRVR